MGRVRQGYILDNKERRGLARQAMLFVLPRIPFTIIGSIVGVTFPVAFAFISAKLRLDHIALVTTLGGILGAFVYKLVLNWGAREYKVGEIAVINSRLDRGFVPNPVFKGGLTLAHTYFESVTFGRVFINLFKGLYKNIFQGKRDEYPIKDTLKAFAIQLRDSILVFCADIFPYLGICCMYNVFSHTNLTTVKAMREGAKIYFKNLHRMLLRNFMNLITAVVLFLVSFSVLFIIMILLCGLMPVVLEQTTKIMEFAQLSISKEDNVIGAPVFLAVVFAIVIVVLSQPSRVIKTLERFEYISDRSRQGSQDNLIKDDVNMN